VTLDAPHLLAGRNLIVGGLIHEYGEFGYERGLTIPNAKQGLCELDGV
jgi:hypothetical protein